MSIKNDLDRRIAEADAALESYDFGDINIVANNGWNTGDADHLAKIIYATYPEDKPDDDSHRISFHVRFDHTGKIGEVYALDMQSGSDLGQKRDMPTIIINVSGGIITEVKTTTPVRVLILDSDIEGADEDRVINVDGDNFFVHDFKISSANELFDPERVKNIEAQVDGAIGNTQDADNGALFTCSETGNQICRMPNGEIAITNGWQTDYVVFRGNGQWQLESDQLARSKAMREFLDQFDPDAQIVAPAM